MIADILILTAVVVFIVDLSGFTDSWRGALSRWLHVSALRPLPPFDCSLCMSWWAGLAYLLVTHHFTLEGVGLVAAASLLSGPIGSLLQDVRDIVAAIADLLYKLIAKIDKI